MAIQSSRKDDVYVPVGQRPQPAAPQAPVPPAPPQAQDETSAMKQLIGDQAGQVGTDIATGAASREASLGRAVGIWSQQNAARQAEIQRTIAAQMAGLSGREDISMLRNAAMGQGPSAAALQAKAQADQIQAQQMAMASARGANPAAMRAAVMAGAGAQQGAAAQGALARSQEQMAAQAQYSQAYDQASRSLLGAQLSLSEQQQQGGVAGLNAMQGAAGLGQQGQLASGDALLKALQMRYGIMRDPEEDAVKQAIAQMTMQGQMDIAQAQIAAQPGMWERIMGNTMMAAATAVPG